MTIGILLYGHEDVRHPTTVRDNVAKRKDVLRVFFFNLTCPRGATFSSTANLPDRARDKSVSGSPDDIVGF